MVDRYHLESWTTEALLEYEERLYDQELAGEDTWLVQAPRRRQGGGGCLRSVDQISSTRKG